MPDMAQTILIAEDNDSVAAPLEQLLAKAGYAVSRAIDGVDALQQIAKSPPDLLLLDLKMPRLHGVELLKKLRQSDKTRDLPVVVMSGVYRGEGNVAAARALGVETYLEKPFRAGDLIGAIQRQLGGASTGETIDRHLLRAFIGQFSGVLSFAIGGRQQRLSFVNGNPVSLRPGVQHENFGDYLRKRGVITVDEYGYYFEAGQCRQETLVQMGCLDWPELMQEKLSYLGSELVSAFAFPPFAAESTPVPLPPEMQIISVNLPRILYGGYHMHPRLEAWQQLRQRHAGHFPVFTEGFYRYGNFLHLKPEEQEFLQQVDGKTALQECLGTGDTLLPLLQTLVSLEMLRLGAEPAEHVAAGMPVRRLFNLPDAEEVLDLADAEPLENFTDLVDEDDTGELAAPPSAPATEVPSPTDGYDLAIGKKVRQTLATIKDRDYYEVFDLRQGEFSFDKLKSRYFAYTHEFGPELLMQLSGEEAALVEEILSLVSTAYNTLSDVVKKERYDELLGADKVGLGHKGDDIFQAQVQSQSGKVFIEMEEWDNAIKALQDAVNFDPENGDYLAHLGWAIYKNPANERSIAMRERGRKMINKALTLDRTAAGHTFKGWLLLEGGQDNLAEAEFSKALKIDARHALARKGLRALQEKHEQEKKGLFRKMFR